MGDMASVLVVCTANICRSPMAAGLLRRDAAAAGLDLEVGSAGFLFDGEPASPTATAVMAELGVDLTGHRSRIVDADLIADHDLVVTMERVHARDLVLAAPGAEGRIHTLGGLVAGLGQLGSGGTPAERIAAVAAVRRGADLLGSGVDEVDDPHGRPARVHRRTAGRLEELVAALVAELSRPA